MARVLITEELATAGIDVLRAAGHDVDEQLGLSADEVAVAVKGAAALIVRSATQVTAELLEAGHELVIVGRAGAGVDNVDVEAATARGVIVANAPGSNVVSTAEHAVALLLSMARNIPQAASALKAGRWEKSKWPGVELYGKTLGLIGMGRIGALVAQRAHAFGMTVIAYDPYVAPDRGSKLGIEIVTLADVVARSDFISIHANKTPETTGIVDAELLKTAKPNLRIVNAARGGIIDEAALAQAIAGGAVAGAALDVFETEPVTDSPLFAFDQVVATPHLAASTPEAQDKAGVMIAEQVVLGLAGQLVPFAVNVDAGEASDVVAPYLGLAARLGSIYGGLAGGVPSVLEIGYHGQLADYDTRILTLSVLKGLFTDVSDEPVSFVNAPKMAEARGVEVREIKSTTAQDYVNLVVVRGGGHAVGGTLTGQRSEPRIVMIDDHAVEVPPATYMLIVRNDDRPGMIGVVGSVLGEAGINISDFHVGRSAAGEAALQVIALDEPAPPEVLARLRETPGIAEISSIAGH